MIRTEQRWDRNICCWSKKSEAEHLFIFIPHFSETQPVRNFGVILDMEIWTSVLKSHRLSLDNHMNKVTRTAFYHLKICEKWENSHFKLRNWSMHSCLAGFASSSKLSVSWLQLGQNSAAFTGTCKFEHITSAHFVGSKFKIVLPLKPFY